MGPAVNLDALEKNSKISCHYRDLSPSGCHLKHFHLYTVHSPTNTLFNKLGKALKLTLKFTLSLLLHVSVYDHHQGAYVRAWLKLYYVRIH
jgi:hypothetical protein